MSEVEPSPEYTLANARAWILGDFGVTASLIEALPAETVVAIPDMPEATAV